MFPTDEVAGRSLDEVVERARAVSSQIARLQAEQVTLIGEIDQRGGTFDGTTTAFVSWQCGLQPGEARRALSLARRLPSVGRIQQAFADGALSEATVRLLATVATPANESSLLATAEVATAAQLCTLVRRYRAIPDPSNADDDDDDDADDDREAPSDLRLHWDDGRLHQHGDFAPADGLDLEQALRLALDHRRAECADRNDLDGLLPDELAPRDHAAALLRLARAYLAGHTTEAGLVPEGHHTLIVTSARALAAHTTGDDTGSNDAGDPTYQPGGPALPAWLAAARACQGSVSALVLDHGQPVTTTVEARFATPAQKRALLARDGCCRFPGCGLAAGLIGHHVVEFDDGGPTRLDNLVLLCRHDHNLVHRKGYTISTTAPGRHTFRRADGTLVPAVNPRPPRSTTGPPPPPGRRTVSARDPLTGFSADVVLHDWLVVDRGRSPEVASA
jgi:hypothetical protein